MEKITRELIAQRFGTVAEFARVVGESPQLVQYWLRAGFYITPDNRIVKLIAGKA